MATRGWRYKRFYELNNGLARVLHNSVRFLAVRGKTLNYAKKRTLMTNYPRFQTSNCRSHSHTKLKGKSGTVNDIEDIEPLVNY